MPQLVVRRRTLVERARRIDERHRFVELKAVPLLAAHLQAEVLPLGRIAGKQPLAHGHNWGVYADHDIEGIYAACERGEFPAGHAYITSSSLKDPTNAGLCGQGQTNLQILGTAPASHAFWGTGAAYARRKREVRDALLATADRAIPGLTASIAHEETASPLTWERHLRCSGGTGYGIAATPDQYLVRRPGPKTHIPGLYLAGHSTRNGHGILGVALGGMEAAAAVTGAPPWPDVHPTPARRATPAHQPAA